jgi:soluble lytic murein transglycosylase
MAASKTVPARHANICLCLLALLAILAGRSTLAIPADRYQSERQSFEKVLKVQAAGKHKLAEKLVLGLESYPLYPYYRFDDLRRRLHAYPVAEVSTFLSAYEDSYLATKLRRLWLAQLIRGQRWAEFLKFYRPTDDTKLRCLQLQARLKTGIPDGVLNDARAIWLNAASLPQECDPIFTRLYASELMGDELVWQRMRLAMAAGNHGLADFLAKRLANVKLKKSHALWALAHRHPARALATKQLADDAETRGTMLYALSRLLRGKLEHAESAWAKLAMRLSFTADEAGQAAAAIATAAASENHARHIALLDAVPAHSVSASVARYRLRRGIGARAWPELVRWTELDAGDAVNPLRWRYWRSRALSELGRHEDAQELLGELALERDYYGFLAADALELEYQLNAAPVAPSAAELAAITGNTGIVRARELYLLDRRYQARREWSFELARFAPRQLEVAASIAAAWGWPDSAIFALGRAKSYDDLDLRFPLLHVDLALKHAKGRGIPAAYVMAIMRSESAFLRDARSPAGALGLMQLLPATARESARRIGLKLGSSKELFDPDTNIALGSTYLAQMLKIHDSNFAMAAAAYNAGPGRVRKWRRAQCTEPEIWIDTIPFTETRRYVRRAYFYAALYELRMHRSMARVSTVMPPIPAAGSSNITDCKT